MRWITIGLLLGLMACVSTAQDEASSGDLTIENAEIITQIDAFGIENQAVQGTLVNTSRNQAYTGIQIYADIFNADDEIIGEGFGFPVNACDTGLLPDFALQPGTSQPFNLLLDLFEDDAIERIEYFPQGSAVPQTRTNPFLTFNDVTEIARVEAVNIEWVDNTAFRYAVGCDRNVFTAWAWWEYDLETERVAAIAHPRAQNVTPAFRQSLELSDDANFNRSYLAFHPTDRRAVYQTDINVMITVEPDGTFKRLLYDDLSRYSLHGYVWLPEGRFIAYYYGAYGDPVRYFTASTSGQLISAPVADASPSFTIPGATPDGSRVIITTTVDDVTGYYLKSTINTQATLLFEAEPPGNNYPAPVFAAQNDGNAFIYIIRPVNNENRLQCYELSTQTLHNLTRLPLNIRSDERAWSALSPDGRHLAITANGINGGVWVVDLTQYDACAGG